MNHDQDPRSLMPRLTGTYAGIDDISKSLVGAADSAEVELESAWDPRTDQLTLLYRQTAEGQLRYAWTAVAAVGGPLASSPGVPDLGAGDLRLELTDSTGFAATLPGVRSGDGLHFAGPDTKVTLRLDGPDTLAVQFSASTDGEEWWTTFASSYSRRRR